MKAQINKPQSLLQDAFKVLLKNLGERKTLELWHTLMPFNGDYKQAREKILKGKSLSFLYKQAKKFNKK